MKKKIQLLSLSLILSVFAFAGSRKGFAYGSPEGVKVSFMQEGGFFGSVFTGEDFKRVDYGFSYTPRLNFLLSENTSVSADIPFALGLSSFVNPEAGMGGMFSFQMPLKASFNYGLGANEDDRFGFFGGSGLGMGYFTFNDFWSSESAFTTGVYLDAGVRADVGDSGGFTLSFNAMIGKRMNIYGINTTMMF